MLPVQTFILLGSLAQTICPERHFFTLYTAHDGRVEALIGANDEYWMTAYRSFIEFEPIQGELMVAFNVGYSEYPSIQALTTNAHIMATTISKGGSAFTEPTNATENAEGYIHGNMVLWYDTMKKEMVMVYQSSGTTETDDGGFEVKLNLIRKDSETHEWSEDQEFLSDLDKPHVSYQFLESSTTNPNGFANKLIIPIHYIAAPDAANTDNKQQVVRISRSLDSDAEYTVSNMEEHATFGDGYYQASIIRVPSQEERFGTELVAFLRDSGGYWLYRSTSNDDGITWTDVAMSAIPNPDQTSQAIYLHNDLVMMIYNPSQSMTSESSPADAYSNCHHLAVALSSDYGMTWQFSRMLEYAYDGMFNNPVGLQDPNCNNIYITYSVMTDETNGCSMLEECTLDSQGTASYIKFTIINEWWVMNDFNYQYDIDNCAWQMADQMIMPKTPSFDTVNVSPSEFNTVLALSIGVGAIALFNISMCYWMVVRKRDYVDLEMSQQRNDPSNYETTN